MRGIIAIWAGAVVDIPYGWHLCDGTNGTPDLTDKFVIGAGDTYDPDDSGGSDSHDHDFTGDGHTHTESPPTDLATGTAENRGVSTEYVTGTTDPTIQLPPYYALAFIQKL